MPQDAGTPQIGPRATYPAAVNLLVRRSRIVRLVAVVLAGVLATTPLAPAGAVSTDPRLTRPVYVDPTTASAHAAASDRTFAPIASRGQAFWLTERFAAADVARVAARYADRARAARRTPLLALYAITARDCGEHSAGGLSPTRYKAWVDQVAAGLRGRSAMVVLEPDALALLGRCEGQGDRLGLLRYATRSLARAGVWVYLDAGHSTWITPRDMAARLASAGVQQARGIATNVSGYRPTADEKQYAGAVLDELARRGVTGKRYVVDTSRNGAAAPVAPGVWCNPHGARLGRAPEVVAGRRLDAYLWVKRPGESDGACEGGPAAGAWWPDGARRLLGR